MKIYALFSSYFDGCEVWEHIIDLYLNFDDALIDQIKLEQDNTDNNQSWFIQEMKVI